MGWFRKKTDPIQGRANELDAQIAALESKIRRLNAQLEKTAQPPAVPTAPRLRTTGPHTEAAIAPLPQRTAPAPVATTATTPIREVDLLPPMAPPAPIEMPAYFNARGVRKFDLLGAFRRFRKSLAGPEPGNPKLVTYLAAGNIHGLRPLRHEKRVARNRFIVLCLVLLGILFAIFKLLVPGL
jgi:hypothetical protein